MWNLIFFYAQEQFSSKICYSFKVWQISPMILYRLTTFGREFIDNFLNFYMAICLFRFIGDFEDLVT